MSNTPNPIWRIESRNEETGEWHEWESSDDEEDARERYARAVKDFVSPYTVRLVRYTGEVIEGG